MPARSGPLSPAAAAAQNAARERNGRFGVQPVAEADGVDILAGEPSRIDSLRTALAHADLPGEVSQESDDIFVYREDADEYRIQVLEAALSVRSSDTVAGVEKYRVALGPAATGFSLDDVAEAVAETRSWRRDIGSFNAAIDKVAADAPFASSGAQVTLTRDYDSGAACWSLPDGASVTVGEFDSHGTPGERSFMVTLRGGPDGQDGSAQFRITRHLGGPDPVRIQEHWTDRELTRWERDGLFAEVNRRAGLHRDALPLPRALVAHTFDYSHSPAARQDTTPDAAHLDYDYDSPASRDPYGWTGDPI